MRTDPGIAGVDYAISILLDGTPPEIRSRIAYAHPSAPTAASARLVIVPSGFFDPAFYGTANSLPRLPLEQIEDLPLLYGAPRFERQGDCLVVHADIIASAFFLLTRYEEVVRREVRDQHGRFLGRESLPGRAGFLDRPLVDEYAALLRKWLREAGMEVPEPARNFSVLLTHDVDVLRRYGSGLLEPARAVASGVLGRASTRQTLERLAVAFARRKDPFDTFDELVALDGGARAAFRADRVSSVYFFLADGLAYDLNGTAAQKALRVVRASGATIGLHAGYEAGKQPSLLSNEVKRLESVSGGRIRCNRHHFLAWREVGDGRALAAAGIDWDSTLGYHDIVGFRLGVCHPIPLFDPVRMELLGIEEHPLIVMDSTLNWTKYMGLDEEGALERCKQLIARTRKHNGEFVALWHNTVFEPAPGNYHPSLYRRMLREIG